MNRWHQQFTAAIRRPSRSTSRLGHRALESLESRTVMTGNEGLAGIGPIVDIQIANAWHQDIFQRITDVDIQVLAPPLAWSVPRLDSNPGAPATLYLNFTGNTLTENWTYDRDRAGTSQGNLKGYETPAFDTDGDATRFSATERDQITEIWRQVADDYSPFNINVTTHYAGPVADGQALMVAVGGRYNRWFDDSTSGYGTDGGFTNDQPNTVLVFADTIEDWRSGSDFVSAVAGTISHEAGHGFGLHHHRHFDSNGKVTEEYSPGTWAWTPIMGDNLANDRTTFSVGQTNVLTTTWSDGSKTQSAVFQNDFQVLASDTNGFGWRPDDYGNYASSAKPLATGILGRAAVSGVIETWGDRDVFRFTTAGGHVDLALDGPTEHANLVGRVSLWGPNGTISTNYMPWTSAHTTLSADLAAGTYFVAVEGLPGLENLGMYTLSLDLPPRWDLITDVTTHSWVTDILINPEQLVQLIDTPLLTTELDAFASLVPTEEVMLVDGWQSIVAEQLLTELPAEEVAWETPTDLIDPAIVDLIVEEYVDTPDEPLPVDPSLDPSDDPVDLDENDPPTDTVVDVDVDLPVDVDPHDDQPSFDDAHEDDVQETTDTPVDVITTDDITTDPTLIGDVNNDGLFDSSDLVIVFQSGAYEDASATDLAFADGDWNGDGRFDTTDLVLAFQTGSYQA